MTAANNAQTVSVACKWPPGLYLRVDEIEEYDTPVVGGGLRREKRARFIGEPFRIYGPRSPRSPDNPKFLLAGGYAITPNVPKDIAEAWMRANKDSPLVKNHVVMIHDKSEYLQSKAKEHREVKSGIEPLDTGTVRKNGATQPADHRWPAKMNANLSAVQTDVRDDA